MSGKLSPRLAEVVRKLQGRIPSIGEERRASLEQLSRFVAARHEAGEAAPLVFICTHNSRRSHMAQIWAQTAAYVYDVPQVQTFSGGTEATAFEPRAVEALRELGFSIESDETSPNPVHRVRLGEDIAAMEVFSKTYDAPPNPREGFCAVMTCSSADADCPVVLGAARRVSLPYDDPKAFDGTELEASQYLERAREIGTQMLFAFSRVGTARQPR